jgi:glycosyltransferase involved in cell wall biosynthesis
MDPSFDVHIPTPGDHYSPATGSALMTIIYELAREHERHGGRTRIVVGRGTRHDYPVGVPVEVDFPPLLSQRRKGADAVLGRLGLPRRFGPALYKPALRAVERDFDGALFVHNNPAPIPMLRRHSPGARLCLYLNNVVFRAYAPLEIRRILDAVDVAVCVSDFIANDLASRSGGSRDKLAVVHNGVDIARFASVAGDSPAGEPVVLFLGRVVPEKGPDLLLRAACELAGRTRPFRIRIVGSSGFSASDPLSDYERELRRIAEPLGGRVEFRPFTDRAGILAEYAQASIFCVPSNWDDPCPLTLLEGLACGLPTVASTRGGIPEAAGDAALYFHPPDVDELAERLGQLLDNEQARGAWGARARARAEALSWSNQYLALRAALGGAGGSAERRGR